MITSDLRFELEQLCVENRLEIDFNFNYPITFTVRKINQVSFLEETPEEAYLRFRFLIDEIKFEFVGDFKLDDKLFSKLLNKIKKFHYIYLQEQYAQKNNRFSNSVKPMFSISNGDYVAIVKKNYEG